jgi:HEAT repeats
MRNGQLSRTWRVLAASTFLYLAVGVSGAGADQSQFVNAKLETRSAAQGLETTVQQIASESTGPLWIAYEVAGVANAEHSNCCWNYHHNDGDSCGMCRLEHEGGNVSTRPSDSGTVKLEGTPGITVLVRAEQKRVMRIRVAPAYCTLDAGGLRVIWIADAKANESVALLTRYVQGAPGQGERDNDLAEQALMAIAQHADASADQALATFVAPGQPRWVRERAAFWLGAARGRAGLTLLEKMAKTDPDPDMREKVAFALFVSREPGAVDDIIRMAKDDESAGVRGQALFWLAQKAGQKASAAISGAIQNDPDTDVKKKAVFALSQMPKDEGVPKLIEVAEHNKNPEVRKQAMFWLGQSNDPRALSFFEQILSH